ncbi:hypothetical protein [Streptomyces sp. NPDC090026]|uniref:hypothetical protein n=1 Tax=Streptomyces sp. NPDC090026 TaxID=3365923 RepID=UPI00380DD5F0
MNTKRLNAAATVILAALEKDRTPMGIALALDSAQALGEFVGCEGRSCRRGEWESKALERGWERSGSGWLCPQCAASAADRADFLATCSQAPATVEFAVDGEVTLTEWSVVDLAPDHYGTGYRQLGGWLPSARARELEHGTNEIVRAVLPGGPTVNTPVNVELTTKAYGEGRSFLKAQWPVAKYPAGWLETLRRTGEFPAPLGGAS